MWRGKQIASFLAVSLLANAMCLPSTLTYRKRRDLSDNQVNSETSLTSDSSKANEISKDNSIADDSKATSTENDDDDDDFDDDFKQSTSSGGGSNIFSLLNLASALFPSLSGNNIKKNNEFVTKLIRDVVNRYQQKRVIQKRKDIGDNVIEIDYATELKPPIFERQESDESDNDSESSESNSEDSEQDNGAEESVEMVSSENGGSKSKQDSASNASNGNGDSNGSDDDNDSDYDEPPGGDGQGGILGLLAGLSGDGESDLGSLLAAVGGIIANLSGDGVDINAIIATALGLFVGLLSDEGSNPGEIIASYLLTSLDTITGGGANNNGAFFGKFLSTLLKGTSAAEDPNESGSQENGGMKMADSAGFFLSLLMGLLGDMSKNSSGSSWRR